MTRRVVLALIPLSALLLADLPVLAQESSARHRPSVTVRNTHRNRVGVQGHVFVPGIGLRPVIRERFPVFGLGFDAHHFHQTRRRFPRRGFHGGGFFGGFDGRRFNGFFSFPFFSSGFSSSSIVVIQQPVPQLVPVVVPTQLITLEGMSEEEADRVVAPGLPHNWGKLRIASDSHPRERAPLPQLTLLVKRDDTIIPAADYWLEDQLVFYVTSSGRQGSFPVRELDWEMSSRLNAERQVDFVLRAQR